MDESADSIVALYRAHTQLNEPSDELVAQLLALLEPGERVLFTCGWTEDLTNHQIEPAVAAVEAALDDLR